MSSRVENLVERGVRRRRAMGIVWLVAAVVATVVLVQIGAPRWWRLMLVAPFALAALGFIQARERTCVFLGLADKRENADGSYSPMPEEDCPQVKRRVSLMLVQILLMAAAATAVVWAI